MATANSVQSKKPSSQWAQAQKTNLQRLMASVLVREGFNPKALTVARQIDQMLKEHEVVSHPAVPHVLPIFLKEGRDQASNVLPLKAVLDVAEALYKDVVKQLPDDQRATAEGLIGSDFSYEHKAVRQKSASMDHVARLLMADPNPKTRSAGQVIWFVSRVFSASPPPVDLNRIKECGFCYRHVHATTVCDRHRTQGKVNVSVKQKASFREMLDEVSKQLDDHLSAHKKDLQVLLKDETAAHAKAAAAVLQNLARQFFSDKTASTLQIALERAGSDFSMHKLAAAWHTLIDVDDEAGLELLEHTQMSDAAELLSHLCRYEAYTRMGGEQPVAARSSLTLNKELVIRIIGMRLAGLKQGEVAKAIGISTAVIRKIERDYEMDEDTLKQATALAQKTVLSTASLRRNPKSSSTLKALSHLTNTGKSRQARGKVAEPDLAKAAVAQPVEPANKSARGRRSQAQPTPKELSVAKTSRKTASKVATVASKPSVAVGSRVKAKDSAQKAIAATPAKKAARTTPIKAESAGQRAAPSPTRKAAAKTKGVTAATGKQKATSTQAARKTVATKKSR